MPPSESAFRGDAGRYTAVIEKSWVLVSWIASAALGFIAKNGVPIPVKAGFVR
jgi:hypothetical protein